MIKFNKKTILILVFFGFFLRFFLLPFPGHEHDMAWWKSWSLLAADKGVVELIANGNWYNYPSFFAMFLFFFGRIFKFFQNPYNVQSYWLTSNFPYLLFFKGILIACDALISWLIYKISQPRVGQKTALVASLAFFLSPVVIFDSSFWGQVDSAGFLFLLFSIYFLIQHRLRLAGFIFVLGFFFKLQNIIFIPLFFLFVFWQYGFKGLFQSLLGSFLAFVFVNLPLLSAKQASLIFASFEKNMDYYPYFSLKAYNFWSLFMKTGWWGDYPDQMLVFGTTTAKSLGMLIFVFSYLLATLVILFTPRNSSEGTMERFLFSCSLASISFYTVTTQMHDRYLFSFFPLLILLFVFSKTLQKYAKPLLLGFCVLNFLYFTNLYAAFSFQYQYLGLKFLNFLNERPYFFFVSLFITLTYLLLIVFSFKYLPKIMAILPLFIPFALLWQNKAYFANKPIPVSRFLVSNWSQSWGRPMKNLSVTSFQGPQSWTRLSNNYFFYDQGIGAHANSEIYLYTQGKFSRFATDYAADTNAADAKMVFQVIADGQNLFTSSPVTKSDLPRHIDLSIKNINKLVLKVTDGGDGINGDHADWLNPVFYK